jgi:hypothetical protein
MKTSLSFAKQVLIESGSFFTMIIGETEDHERVALQGLFGNEQEKDLFLKFVAMTFLVKKVKRYVALSEAWMSESSTKYPESNSPRIECLIAIEVVYGKPHGEGIVYEIKRQDKKVLNLEEKTSMNYIEGRFAELLLNQEKIPPFLSNVVTDFIKNHSVTIH